MTLRSPGPVETASRRAHGLRSRSSVYHDTQGASARAVFIPECSQGAGEKTEADLSRQFSERKRPEEIEEVAYHTAVGGPVWAPKRLAAAGITRIELRVPAADPAGLGGGGWRRIL